MRRRSRHRHVRQLSNDYAWSLFGDTPYSPNHRSCRHRAYPVRVGRPRRNDLELARESAEVWADSAREQNIWFLSSTFVRTSLPYQKPSEDTLVWHRRNGDFLLKMTPGGKVEDNVGMSLGLPYGAVPRLLLAYVTTEVVKTRKPEIVLPSSLAQFMNRLGMKPTGGKNGTITRLRDQAERLLEATFTVRWEGERQRDVGAKFNIASAWDLDWAPKSRNRSFINVSQEFCDEIMSGPVPLDFDAYCSLGGSAFRMDQLTWLSHRMSTLKHPVTVPWDSLRGQFGFQLADDTKGRSKFKALFIKNLSYVLQIYREANVEPTASGLLLRPSPTHVLPRGLRALKAI